MFIGFIMWMMIEVAVWSVALAVRLMVWIVSLPFKFIGWLFVSVRKSTILLRKNKQYVSISSWRKP